MHSTLTYPLQPACSPDDACVNGFAQSTVHGHPRSARKIGDIHSMRTVQHIVRRSPGTGAPGRGTDPYMKRGCVDVLMFCNLDYGNFLSLRHGCSISKSVYKFGPG